MCDAPEQLEATRRIFEEADLRPKYREGFRYVGGYIGTEETRKEWLEPQVQKWAVAVETLATFA
eukprot:10833506-Ditylum_brightwellii.AAC.1